MAAPEASSTLRGARGDVGTYNAAEPRSVARAIDSTRPHPAYGIEQSAVPPEPVGRDKFAGAPENAFKVVREAPV